MPRAWVVPSQLLPPAFSARKFFNNLWPSRLSTASYEKIYVPAGPYEGYEEDGFDGIQKPRTNASRSKIIYGLPIACLLIATTLIARYSLTCCTPTHSAPPNKPTSVSPLRLFYKTHTLDGAKCNPPVKVVTNEDEAQVVIWSNPAQDLSIFDGEKARREKPWQLNAFWSLENEEYYEALKDARTQLEAGDPKAFDLAITYRTDSDFPIPYAYSYLDLRKKSLPFQDRRQDKLVAAFISNCHPLNDRTKLLDQLMKLLPGQIDSFGSCRNNADPDKVINQFNWNPSNGKEPPKTLERGDQKRTIISRYKFTIAFENANEPDYVTEKYYQALEAGSIPISLGQTRENFKKFKPSANAALNVADFESMEELAKQIKQIGSDASQFESMLQWKNRPYPEYFSRLVSFGKDHETCRLAKWAQNQWQNPILNDTTRYESLRARLKLPHKNSMSNNTITEKINS